MAYGFSGYVGVAREAAWGSAQNASSFVEALNESIHLEIDRFPYKNIIGTMAEPDDIGGVQRVSGPMSFAAHPGNIGFFLMSTFGNVATTVVLSGFLWNHVYKSPTNSNSEFSTTAPSVPYTFEVFRDVTTATQYAGGLVSALTLNFAPNQDVRATATILGRSTRYAAAQAPTFPSTSAKPFTFDTASVQLGGAATTKIEALTISIENQYEGIPALDMSTVISKVRRTGPQMVNVTGTLDFISHAEYDDFLAQSETNLKVSVTKASSFQMTIDIPRLVYTAFPLGIPGKERIMVDFTAKGYYHSTSATAIAVSLTTTKSYH
jgi:hypothetical protein